MAKIPKLHQLSLHFSKKTPYWWALCIWAPNLCASRSKIFQPLLFSKIFLNSILVKNVLEVLELNSGQKCTRSSRLLTSKISSKWSTFHFFSLKHWGSKFLNFLSRKGVLPKNFGSMKHGEETDFVHTFRDLHILSNMDLVKFVSDR